jgi:hypothetical protein
MPTAFSVLLDYAVQHNATAVRPAGATDLRDGRSCPPQPSVCASSGVCLVVSRGKRKSISTADDAEPRHGEDPQERFRTFGFGGRDMSFNLMDMNEAQQQFLDFLDTMKNAQQTFADAVESWGGAFDVGQSASSWSLEPLPPRELVETTFDLVERLLAAQKQLAIALVDATGAEAT